MKVLSINLWFDKYGQKTIAELVSFAYYDFETYAATIFANDSSLDVVVYEVTGNSTTEIHRKSFSKSMLQMGYCSAFKYLFRYAEDNKFDLVYMRRLMSKIIFAKPYFRRLSMHSKIAYEIPTYPFDIPSNKLYALRDKVEWSEIKKSEKYFSSVSACVYQNAKAPDNWIVFDNGLNINNFTPKDKPELTDTINMLMIANMASWHRSERILYAINNYSGPYNLHLVVASPSSKEYNDMKNLAKSLGISECIDFYDYLPLTKINELSDNIHLAVGQLSGSEYGVMDTHALKHKDYCALALPTFSTCKDSSFGKDYPYYYFIEDTDAEIDLESIIKWYENIYKDDDYRKKMYDYAKNNLQFHSYVKKVLNKCGF